MGKWYNDRNWSSFLDEIIDQLRDDIYPSIIERINEDGNDLDMIVDIDKSIFKYFELNEHTMPKGFAISEVHKKYGEQFKEAFADLDELDLEQQYINNSFREFNGITKQLMKEYVSVDEHIDLHHVCKSIYTNFFIHDEVLYFNEKENWIIVSDWDLYVDKVGKMIIKSQEEQLKAILEPHEQDNTSIILFWLYSSIALDFFNTFAGGVLPNGFFLVINEEEQVDEYLDVNTIEQTLDIMVQHNLIKTIEDFKIYRIDILEEE